MSFFSKDFGKTLLFLCGICSSIAYAGHANSTVPLMKDTTLTYPREIISLLGGYANLDAPNSKESFAGTDDDVFIYIDSNKSNNTGLIGTFVGLEWLLLPQFLIDTGVEYDYFFGTTNISGSHTVGIEPATSTPYNYDYNVQSQQVIAVAKLLYITPRMFHPYFLVGLGAAFNRASDYSVTTTQVGSINLTPTFESNNNTSFTYSVGVGVDMDVTSRIRVGIGYRFSDLGKFSLGHGTVTFNDYQSAVPFTLNGSHIYINQLLVDLSYLI